MDYVATVEQEPIDKKKMVWYKGMLMTQEEAEEMRENGD